MPPFRLELPDRKRNKIARLFVSKNLYGPNVYVKHWDDYRLQFPIDNDPLEENNVNHFISHYDGLGVEPCTDFRTTTQLMLEQIKLKETTKKQEPRATLINFFSFNESHCPKKQRWCMDNCPNFSTTMQDSYKMPYPYPMKRLSMPKIPHLKYRRMVGEDALCEDKFLDDGFIKRTRDKIAAKCSQFVSFSPFTGLMTDGSMPKGDKPQACYINFKTN